MSEQRFVLVAEALERVTVFELHLGPGVPVLGKSQAEGLHFSRRRLGVRRNWLRSAKFRIFSSRDGDSRDLTSFP